MARVVDVHDYTELWRKTRTLRPEIRKDLRQRLRTCGRVGADAAKAKVRTMTSSARTVSRGHGRHLALRSGKARGLRATLAANIRVQVSGDNVRIRQFTAGLQGHNAANLPKDIERGEWLHPTLGHDPEVLQTATPYFRSAIEGQRKAMLNEVGKVLDEIAKRIT